MNSGIYKIENLVNGKMYIGSAKNLIARKNSHFSALRNNKHSNKYLQNSFNKHGENNFKWHILEICNIDKLIEREQYYINLIGLEKLFNIRKNAESNIGISINKGKNNPFYGKTHTKEIRERLRKSTTKRNLENHSFKGKKHTEESKKKISESLGNKNVKLTLEECIEIKGLFLKGLKYKDVENLLPNVNNRTLQRIRQGKHYYSPQLGGSYKEWINNG